MLINGYPIEEVILRENGIPRFYGNPNWLHIGEHVELNNTFFNVAKEIFIEDHVFFGHNCMVLTGVHNYEKREIDRRIDIAKSKPVRIKQGAWIASGAIILPGVTIGEHAVIGAGSVVTKDVKANCLYAGNPARFIKNI